VVLSSFVSCESYYAISIISLGSSVTPPVKWPFKPDRDVQKNALHFRVAQISFPKS
jgi:hypothetical protein